MIITDSNLSCFVLFVIGFSVNPVIGGYLLSVSDIRYISSKRFQILIDSSHS